MFSPRVTAVMMLPTASGECLMMRAGQFARGRQQRRMRHHDVDEPDLQRALRRERIARQQQLERALAPGEARQPLRSAEGRRHAEIDFRLGETRALAGDGQMHGLGDLAAAAERQAVDRGDDRFPEGFEPRGHGLAAPDEVAHGRIAALANAHREFVDVGAGGKGAFARAGQDHGAHAGVGLDRSSVAIRRSISA